MAGTLAEIHPKIDEKYFNHFVGLTLKQCAEVCDVHQKTAVKWQKSNSWPTWARRLVMLHGGMFSQKGWSGWQIHPADNKLYCPDLKYGFAPEDIASIHYLRQRCDQLERLLKSQS